MRVVPLDNENCGICDPRRYRECLLCGGECLACEDAEVKARTFAGRARLHGQQPARSARLAIRNEKWAWRQRHCDDGSVAIAVDWHCGESVVLERLLKGLQYGGWRVLPELLPRGDCSRVLVISLGNASLPLGIRFARSFLGRPFACGAASGTVQEEMPFTALSWAAATSTSS